MVDPANPWEQTSDNPPPRPRWVKGLLIAVLLVVAVLVVLKVAGVEHGPSRHGSLGSSAFPSAYLSTPATG